MSEEKKVRSKEELSNLYMNILAQVGERIYKIKKLEGELGHFEKEIDALQLEASQLPKEEVKVSE